MINTQLASSLMQLLHDSNVLPVIALEAKSHKEAGLDIRKAFEMSVEDVDVTLATCKRVIAYSKQLASKEEHSQFLGSNLLGVHRIYFYPADRYRWFDEVLQIDDDYLKSNIDKVPSIGDDWKVAGDAFNLSIVWFIHRAFKNLGRNNAVALEAAKEALIILQFKLITSVWYNSFDKPVDMAAAAAVYNRLSLQFAIKALGSWHAVFVSRAESFLDTKNPKGHYIDFINFDNDERIMYILTDMSTRIRKSIKDQYAVLDQVRSSNMRVESMANTLVVDGTKISKDNVSNYSSARHYLIDVSGNESSFIKNELIDVVMDMMPTTSRSALIDVLVSIARQPTGKKRDEVEHVMDDTLMHAFDYMSSNHVSFNDIYAILIKLRGLYTSSKTKDVRLLSLRTRIEKYAKHHSQLRASSALASVRTAVMLYFVLRSLASNTYA